MANSVHSFLKGFVAFQGVVSDLSVIQGAGSDVGNIGLVGKPQEDLCNSFYSLPVVLVEQRSDGLGFSCPAADGKIQPFVEEPGSGPAVKNIQDRLGDGFSRQLAVPDDGFRIGVMPDMQQRVEQALAVFKMPIETGARGAKPFCQRHDFDGVHTLADQKSVGFLQPVLTAVAVGLGFKLDNLGHGLNIREATSNYKKLDRSVEIT